MLRTLHKLTIVNFRKRLHEPGVVIRENAEQLEQELPKRTWKVPIETLVTNGDLRVGYEEIWALNELNVNALHLLMIRHVFL